MGSKTTINAIEMVRRIRDAHYEQTKEMTFEERLAYYRQKGQQAHEELKRMADK